MLPDPMASMFLLDQQIHHDVDPFLLTFYNVIQLLVEKDMIREL